MVGYQSAYEIVMPLLFEPHGAGVAVWSASTSLPEIMKNNSREKLMVAQVDRRQGGIFCFKFSFQVMYAVSFVLNYLSKPFMYAVKLF